MPLFSFDRGVLNDFSVDARSLLETMLFSQAGMLTAPQVEELATRLSVSVEALSEKLLPVAAACAVVPISHFHVGVVLRGGSGALYLGANMELSHSFLGLTLHGEQSAVNNAWAHGEKSVTALVVNAAPCGHCRQFLHELDCSDRLDVKIVSAEGKSHHAPLQHYLPEAFGPANLGVQGGILSAQPVELKCDSSDELATLALNAANSSYAPYTKGYAGVALETVDGVRVSGRYAENAAYNPSMQPFTSALSQLRFQCLGQQIELKEMVMIEAASQVSHGSHWQALQHLFPELNVRILRGS